MPKPGRSRRLGPGLLTRPATLDMIRRRRGGDMDRFLHLRRSRVGCGGEHGAEMKFAVSVTENSVELELRQPRC